MSGVTYRKPWPTEKKCDKQLANIPDSKPDGIVSKEKGKVFCHLLLTLLIGHHNHNIIRELFI